MGKGGEGTVYRHANSPELAVKIYNSEQLAQSREPKISRVVNDASATGLTEVAFPKQKVVDEKGRFLGFTMPMVSDHRPVFEVFGPGSRKQAFPRADFRFLVRIAKNLAVVAAKIHQLGYVIGDINSNGIYVAQDATVRLIDADSFQFGAENTNLFCTVGVADFTPPELHGADFSKRARSVQHDAFGIAVSIFQILFIGRHPYMGSFEGGEKTIAEAIKEHRFVYSSQRKTRMKLPPGMGFYFKMPSFVQDGFERAFRADVRDKRPTPNEWIEILTALETSLTQCSVSTSHYHPKGMSCPWCMFDKTLGIDIFPPTLAELERRMSSGSADDKIRQLDHAWDRIGKGFDKKLASVSPRLPQLALTPNADIRRDGRSNRFRPLIILSAIVGALVLITIEPSAWLLYVGGVFAAIFGTKVAPRSNAELLQRHRVAVENRNQAILQWRRSIGVEGLYRSFSDAYDEYHATKDRFDEQKKELSSLNNARVNQAKKVYLSQFHIKNSKIPKLKENDYNALQSYGIHTAADVNKWRAMQVPGIGEVKSGSLVSWKRQLETAFNPDKYASHDERRLMAQAKYEFTKEISDLSANTLHKIERFADAKSRVNSKLAYSTQKLLDAHEALEQLRVDLHHVGIPLPTVDQPPALKVNWPLIRKTPKKAVIKKQKPQRKTTSSSRPDCPRCGANMVRRTARRGPNSGNDFWGCSRFPRCRGTRNI
ncbi:MAG: topoisomerase DNA-binding C4 zinc finger domain-containing protein [Pseudomonadota bacterium]